MSTYVIFADTDEGYRTSGDNTGNYAAAANDTGDGHFVDASANTVVVGQLLSGTLYQVRQSYFHFDTTGLPTPTDATLSCYLNIGVDDQSDTDFVIEARVSAWAAPLAVSEWRTPAQIAAISLAASLATSGLTLAAYNDFVTQPALLSAINLSGITGIFLSSDHQRTSTAPTAFEQVSFRTQEGTQPARLTVLSLVNTGLFQRRAAFGLLGVM